MPRLLQHEPDAVDVDLHAEVEVVLSAARHDTVQAVDDSRGAERGREKVGDGGGGREVGADGDAASRVDAGGSFWLNCEERKRSE